MPPHHDRMKGRGTPPLPGYQGSRPCLRIRSTPAASRSAIRRSAATGAAPPVMASSSASSEPNAAPEPTSASASVSVSAVPSAPSVFASVSSAAPGPSAARTRPIRGVRRLLRRPSPLRRPAAGAAALETHLEVRLAFGEIHASRLVERTLSQRYFSTSRRPSRFFSHRVEEMFPGYTPGTPAPCPPTPRRGSQPW